MAEQKSILAQISENTLRAKLGMWAKNFRENYDDFRDKKDILDIPKCPGPALCLAAGKSLDLHLDEIHRFQGTVFSCERNLVPVLQHGVVPKYVVSIDGDPILAKFIQDPIVKEHADEMTGLFATTVSRKMVEDWPGEIVWFNAWIDDVDALKSVSMVLQEVGQKATMQTGGTAGSTLWFAALTLECDPMVLIGLDYAYPTSMPYLDETQIWPQVCHLSREQILAHYARYHNRFNNDVITDIAWHGLGDAFTSWTGIVQDHTTYQCSDYTTLDAAPLICMPFSQYLDEIQGKTVTRGHKVPGAPLIIEEGDQVTVLHPQVVKVGGDTDAGEAR